MATAGGVGYSPIAPGTAGSLLALAVLWVARLSPMQRMIVLLVIVGVGWWAAGRAERLLGGKDPTAVVIDEVGGMVLSVAMLPRSVALFLAAFLLFRVLDIAKPFPIRRAELVPGGLGVMLDDLIAGVYTLAILRGLLAALGIPA